jgi:hypothetical protein
MAETALQAGHSPAVNAQCEYGLRKGIVAAAVAVLASVLVVATGVPASALITNWRGEVSVETSGSINTPSNNSTTVHGDGIGLTAPPLSGYCYTGNGKNDPLVGKASDQFAAAQAPWVQGGQVKVTIEDTGGDCDANLPNGDYHVSLIEHAFTNKDLSTNANGDATYGHHEVVADCTRKDVFTGGTAFHSNELSYSQGNGPQSATVPYFFTHNQGPGEAGGVCISHPNKNAGIMIPISANFL